MKIIYNNGKRKDLSEADVDLDNVMTKAVYDPNSDGKIARSNLEENLIEGVGTSKVVVSDDEPLSPATGDIWIHPVTEL